MRDNTRRLVPSSRYSDALLVQKSTCFTGTQVQVLTQLEVQFRREAVRGERGGLEGSREAVTKEQAEFMVTVFFGPMKTQERMKEKVLLCSVY